MKAIVPVGYGPSDVLEFREIEIPAVDDDKLLIRVRAATLSAGDYFSMRGSPWVVRLLVGLLEPRNHIPGWDVARRVEAVGEGVMGLKPGDDVFGMCEGSCAEYVCVEEEHLVPVPANLSFGEAAAVPTAALTALRYLGEGHARGKVVITV